MLGWMPWVLKVVTMRSLSQGKSYLIAPSVPLPSQQGLILKSTCQHTLRKSVSSEISATINHNHGRAKTFQLALPPCYQFVAIWEKATFFFKQLFPVVARTWWAPRSERLFLGPKFRFLAQKSDFCHTTPILVDDPFLALGMTVNFPPWKPFFDFPFRSYSCFRKKIWLTAQKVFPPPTVGVPSASKSPSALSAQALRARALHARAW